MPSNKLLEQGNAIEIKEICSHIHPLIMLQLEAISDVISEEPGRIIQVEPVRLMMIDYQYPKEEIRQLYMGGKMTINP